MTNERDEKREKPIQEMTDRELAEHVLGRELVEKLHEEFDLREGSMTMTTKRIIRASHPQNSGFSRWRQVGHYRSDKFAGTEPS